MSRRCLPFVPPFTASPTEPWDEEAIVDLTGKTALVTGATSGIGFEVALQLATHGARVLVAGRTQDKVDDAVKQLRTRRPGCKVDGVLVDLSSFPSIDAAVKTLRDTLKLKALHILVANAGVFLPPYSKIESSGFEPQLGVNLVGTVYLTHKLLPLLIAAKPARVVVVSSNAASTASDIPWTDLGGEQLTECSLSSYAQSKLCGALYALALHTRHSSDGIEAFAVHPGFVATPAQEKVDPSQWVAKLLPVLTPLFSCPPREGARSALFAATAPELAGKGGSCYGPDVLNRRHTGEWTPHDKLYTKENAERVLEEVLKLIAAKGGKLDKGK